MSSITSSGISVQIRLFQLKPLHVKHKKVIGTFITFYVCVTFACNAKSFAIAIIFYFFFFAAANLARAFSEVFSIVAPDAVTKSDLLT